MRLTLRPAHLEDAHDLAEIFASSWRSAYTGLIPQSEIDRRDCAMRERQFRVSLAAPDHGFYLALLDGHPCGAFILGPSRDPDLPDWGELRSFYTLESVWGTGAAQDMMAYALDQLLKKGYSDVFLWVLTENSRARRFYERFAFQPDGHCQEAYPGVSEIRYIRARNDVL